MSFIPLPARTRSRGVHPSASPALPPLDLDNDDQSRRESSRSLKELHSTMQYNYGGSKRDKSLTPSARVRVLGKF
jgi:hypothetical protein